jgi:hypothetical protein
MFAKMGYNDGEGLVKTGGGIREPVVVRKRPERLGLGTEIPNDARNRKPKASSGDDPPAGYNPSRSAANPRTTTI